MKHTATEAEKKAVLNAVFAPLEGEPPVRSSELVVPRLIAKWREHAKEAARDLGAAIDCASRTRLVTEARILERCARQLEQGLARHNDPSSATREQKP